MTLFNLIILNLASNMMAITFLFFLEAQIYRVLGKSIPVQNIDMNKIYKSDVVIMFLTSGLSLGMGAVAMYFDFWFSLGFGLVFYVVVCRFVPSIRRMLSVCMFHTTDRINAWGWPVASRKAI